MLVIFVLFGHKIWNVDKFVYVKASLKCRFKTWAFNDWKTTNLVIFS